MPRLRLELKLAIAVRSGWRVIDNLFEQTLSYNLWLPLAQDAHIQRTIRIVLFDYNIYSVRVYDSAGLLDVALPGEVEV